VHFAGPEAGAPIGSHAGFDLNSALPMWCLAGNGRIHFLLPVLVLDSLSMN